MTIDELANHIAQEIPEGYVLSLYVENGSGGIQIESPEEFEYWESDGANIEAQMLEALKYIKSCAASAPGDEP